MANRLQRNDNGVYTKDYYILGQPVQTIGAAVLIVAEIPTVINKGYVVTVRFACTDPLSVSNTCGGEIKGYYRRLAGNITQIDNEIRETVTGFIGTVPNIRTKPNIINQTIEIEITGKAGLNLDWIIEFVVDYRT